MALSFEGGKNEYQLHLKLHGVRQFHSSRLSPVFMPLLQVIEPSQSSAELMGSKVELKLRKAECFPWPTLVTKSPLTREVDKEEEI